MTTSERRRLRVLTVGDGDLSCSLALNRAYGNQIELVATTLLASADALARAYPQADIRNTLEELLQQQQQVKFGVDATNLLDHREDLRSNEASTPTRGGGADVLFDCVLFHHPHLGYYNNSKNEQDHAQRHISLIAHYLASAKSLLSATGRVHLCLCGTQEYTWQVEDTAQRLGLKVTTSSVQRPILESLLLLPSSASVDCASTTTSRKFRRAHWLGKFGYRHQPTHVATTKSINVAASRHYWFQPMQDDAAETRKRKAKDNRHWCSICDREFADEDKLKEHMETPALPYHHDEEPTDDPDHQMKKTESTGSFSSPIQTGTFSPKHRTTITRLVVSPEHAGKRLKWFVNRSTRASKRLSVEKIHQGSVKVNGETVTDDARVLEPGWNVEIFLSERSAHEQPQSTRGEQQGPCCRAENSVASLQQPRLVTSWDDDDAHVVWKPAGLRTLGRIPNVPTLEALLPTIIIGDGGGKQQQQQRYVPLLPRLETGQSGLVVVSDEEKIINVSHTWAALVYGHVPHKWRCDGGATIQIRVNQARKWNKKDKTCAKTVLHREDNASETELYETAVVRLLEETVPAGKSQGDSSSIKAHLQRGSIIIPALSTVSITTNSKGSGIGSTLAYWLRQQGHGVVGDRFTNAKEYNSLLPRGMRNRIKQKVCLGCIRVEHDDSTKRVRSAEVPLPRKWSAAYWHQQLSAETSKDG